MARALLNTGSDLTLEALMERYVRGEDRAFDDLYRSASPILRNAVTRWTRDSEQVEDVLQASFLKLHRAKDTYNVGEPLLPWLFVIAKRTLLDEQRPLRARYEVLSAEGDGSATLEARNPSPNSEPLDLELREALGQLPAQYRDAITMTKLAGFSGNEAATFLNTTKAAIKQRVHRGYSLLRQLFEQSGSPAAA